MEGPIGDVREQAATVRRNRPRRGHEHGGMERGIETVREDDYRGHHIVIRTMYTIEVDGRPVTGHVGVGNDGRVHYHPVPNLSFVSAVDLVRRLIDTFPDEFPPEDVEQEAGPDGHHHQHHGRG